jgi:ABC-type sugar transport system substrate-binding protein
MTARGNIITAVLMGVALSITTGCGASGEGTGQSKQLVIASLVQPTDNPWVQNNVRFQQDVARALGIKLIIASDQGTDESNVATMRSLIAKNPDGILFDPISEAAAKQDAALLEQYKIPGVTEDRLVVHNISEYQGQYLQAQVTQSNMTWGYNTMTSLIKSGATKIATILPPHGILTVEELWAGAKKALGEHPEVTLIQESWVTQNRESAVKTEQQYLTKYGRGQLDGLFAIGSTMALGASYANKQAGRTEIKIATADDDPDVIQALKTGELVATYGTHWTNGGWGLIVLFDYLKGHKPLSRQPTFNLFNINKDNADSYAARFITGAPLTGKEIQSLSLANNSKADLPDFLANFYLRWADANRGVPG